MLNIYCKLRDHTDKGQDKPKMELSEIQYLFLYMECCKAKLIELDDRAIVNRKINKGTFCTHLKNISLLRGPTYTAES